MAVDVLTDMRVQQRAYPEECSNEDIIGEIGFLEKVCKEFGMRFIRGTALGYHNFRDLKRYNVEELFREVVRGRGNAIEIGTFRGVSTAVMAHYYDSVTTVDVYYPYEALNLWQCYGVQDKIRAYVVSSEENKRITVEEADDFNFAFIDGDHTYEAVKYDFELTHKCGHVVFHDYGLSQCPGITQFVNELPKAEVTEKFPFAIWKCTE